MSYLDVLGPDVQDHLLARANQLVKSSSLGWKDAGRELLHDAFVKALEIQGKYKGEMTPKAVGGFVYGIINHLHMNRNTVEFGRGRSLGRKKLLRQHIREQAYLYRPGGRRVSRAKPDRQERVLC